MKLTPNMFGTIPENFEISNTAGEKSKHSDYRHGKCKVYSRLEIQQYCKEKNEHCNSTTKQK